MKMRLILAALLLGGSALLAHAASPAMAVQVIQTDKRSDYLALLAKSNARIKALTGIDHIRHAWTGDFAGDGSNGLVVVSLYDSAAAMAEIQAKVTGDPELKELMKEFSAIRKLGPAWLYKGVRFEGLYDGGCVLNTTIAVTSEADYLKALDELRGVFDANGFKDAKLNCFRVAAGRENETHLVVICLPDAKRLGALVDAIVDTPMMKDWSAGVAKIRTTLHNGTYHELEVK